MMPELQVHAICKICHLQKGAENHTSEIHQFNTLLYEWNTYKRALVKNRDGITITQSIVNDGITGDETSYDGTKGKLLVRLTPQKLKNLSRTVRVKFTIRNDRKSESIHLIKAQMLYPISAFHVEDDLGIIETNKYLEIPSKKEYVIYVKFIPSSVDVGDYKNQLVIKFQTDNKPVQQINFFRDLQVTVSDVLRDVDNTNETPFRNEQWDDDIEIKPSVGRQSSHDVYPIPDQYFNILFGGLKVKDFYTELDKSCLENLKLRLCHNYNGRSKFIPLLTRKNYQDFFHILLWMDEVYAAVGIRQYNMSSVSLRLVMPQVIELEVRGLAEKRPSLVVGDLIRLRVHEDHTGYEGVVKTINDTTIWIHNVHQNLLDILEDEPQFKFDVAFRLGRLPYERKHKGVDDCMRKGLLNNLFPDGRDQTIPKRIYRLQDMRFYNNQVASNPEQRTAVLNILNETAFPYPFVVLGPPGTGKTVTIVEAILQLKRLNPAAKILVCAPSNAACDMLASKLSSCDKKELLRLHKGNRTWADIPDVVKQFSNHDGRAVTRIDARTLAKYKIVITTLVLIGKYSGQYTPDYVFIDEAAQACEPEAAIAISMLDKAKLVLAGDHLQLGPCGSKLAIRYGLGLSLLERLVTKNQLYEQFHPRYISMLRLNYRAHTLVLHVPNALFYENKLKAININAQQDPVAKLCVYRLTKAGKDSARQGGSQIGFPVEFCSVIALEQRQGKSPSFFNPREIEMVVNYVHALRRQTSVPVSENDIGIISPYVRQVHRIKEDLKRAGYQDIEVGTTEAFQGREKRVMIISTVRGRHNLMLYDKKYDLGFVNSDKRMNVALTRAMSKLIIIGNPLVLNSDSEACKKWRFLIEFCERNNSSFGMAYQRRDQSIRQEVSNRVNTHNRDRYDVNGY